MKTSSVNSLFQTQSSQPVAAQFRGCAPKDILTQGTSSSSSDGFLMCMLKPICRFFQSIFSFFKYLLCCSSASSQLPKLTPQLLERLMKLVIPKDNSRYFKAIQKSDGCIAFYGGGKFLCSFEIVPFEKSFAIQIKQVKGKQWRGIVESVLLGSSALLTKEIPDDEIETAKQNGFIKEGDFWVKRGPVEGVISETNKKQNAYAVGFLKEDNTFEVVAAIMQKREDKDIFDVSGLEMCPGRVKDLVTWTRSMIGGEFTLVVAPEPGEIDSELKEAGFKENDDNEFILEVSTDE